MDEVLDIFDEQMNHIGTATRAEVHRYGYWHQTFHCWVVQQTSRGEVLLLQRRHATKDTNPNKLDISCAGHLDAGEQPENGIRELKEELGIDVSFDILSRVGLYQDRFSSGTIQDNEFAHIFLFYDDRSSDLALYSPALGEVSGLFQIGVSDLAHLWRREVDTVFADGFELTDDGQRMYCRIPVQLHDLVERDVAYYELLFNHVRKRFHL